MRETPSSGPRSCLLAGAAVWALLCPGTGFAATVGTAGAANTRSTGTPPGSSVRVIEIGAQVVSDEKIETSASGSVQLLFIDKTTLSIGPNSSLVIDKFVFNPATAQGEMAISLSKGVLRVVGGQVTHTGGATITTPVATLGLRGGIVSMKHSAAEGTQAILGFGVMTMTSGGVAETVTRPGFLVRASSAGSPPSTPVKATLAQIDQSNSAVTSKGGQTGGSSVAPTDRQAAANNVGTTTSLAAPLQIINRTQASSLNAISGLTDAIAQQGAQVPLSTQVSVLPSPPPPPPATPTPAAPTPVAPPPQAFALVTTAGAGSGVPFLTASFAGTGAFNVSPILGFAAGGFNADGTPNTTSRALQASLSVNGKGAAQTSALSVMTAIVLNDPVFGPTFAGGVVASARQSPTAITSARLQSAVSSLPNSVQVNSNGLPTNAFGTNQNLFVGAPVSKFTAQPGFTNAGGTPTNFNFNQTVTPVATPAGLGADHPNALLTAFVGGIMQTLSFATANPGNATPVASFGTPYIVQGQGQVFLDGASSKIGASFSVSAGSGPTLQLTSATFNFGSVDPGDLNNTDGLNTARGTFVDRTNFAARSQVQFANGADIENSNITDGSGKTFQNANARTAGNVNVNTGTSIARTDLMMVTANTVGANTSSFLTSISTAASVAPCQCEFTQWGFWGANTLRADNVNNVSFSDNGNLMVWVAGIPANAADIPTTGSATYTGHAIADISNNGVQYIAAGTFSNNVNFATRTGQVQIGGLDNANFNGVVNLTPNTANFVGFNLNGGTTGRTASINGQFFQGGPTNTTPLFGEMGGNIHISGPNNYLGSGIFVGRKP